MTNTDWGKRDVQPQSINGQVNETTFFTDTRVTAWAMNQVNANDYILCEPPFETLGSVSAAGDNLLLRLGHRLKSYATVIADVLCFPPIYVTSAYILLIILFFHCFFNLIY